jgi:hypothetical protein
MGRELDPSRIICGKAGCPDLCVSEGFYEKMTSEFRMKTFPKAIRVSSDDKVQLRGPGVFIVWENKGKEFVFTRGSSDMSPKEKNLFRVDPGGENCNICRNKAHLKQIDENGNIVEKSKRGLLAFFGVK